MSRKSNSLHGVMLATGTLLLCAACAVGKVDGTARGESSDERGQQGVGLGSKEQKSNVIMGGPDIVVGKISKIKGDQYSIKGDRGQEISLRVTKDTNLVCAEGQGARFSTGQQSGKEHQEIAPTQYMEQQAGKRADRAISEQEMTKQLQDSSTQEEVGALSKDPSQMKDVVGSTDPKANEDVAKGSGFVVGGKGGCHFQVGDQVRIEASDMGTATTIHQLTASGSSR